MPEEVYVRADRLRLEEIVLGKIDPRLQVAVLRDEAAAHIESSLINVLHDKLQLGESAGKCQARMTGGTANL